MIEHYALYETDKLTDRFGLTDGVPKGVKPRYNITPTEAAFVVVADDTATQLKPMNWGLVSRGAKDMNAVFRYKTFNVKSEKVFSKPSWDAAIRAQRCIIPVNGFYMIRSDNGDAYYFTSPATSLLGIAGIYTSWIDASGKQANTFTMLTIQSNEKMPLPFATMPVILHADDEAGWIDPAMNDFSTLVRSMRPYEGAKLDYTKVSGDVSSKKVDSPNLIQSI